MKTFILFFLSWVFLSTKSFSQGCIAIRNISGFGQYNFTDKSFSTSDWQLDVAGRYFKSFRDFKEKTDLKTPPQNESVNVVYTVQTSLTKLLAHGWSLNLRMPVTTNARTSSFEHGGPNTPRHTTSSFGIGDISFTAYKWILPPSVTQKWNLQFGLGVKFPTGDYKYEDYFYRNDTTKILSAVNPGIQLGDGGTGIITELNTFYILNKTINFYGNFYYLISPRNENGTLYTQGKTPTPVQLESDGINNSVPDVFALRAGVLVNVHQLSFSAGIRDEGTPVYDLIGKNDGIRRAGYYFSVEPGVLFKTKNITAFTYVPIIVGRRIKQNVPDKNATKITGVYTVGPGGSANYMIIAGVSFQL